MRMLLSLRPRMIVRTLAACIVVLVVLGVGGALVAPRITHGWIARVVRLVSLDGEWNLASWYATLTLGLCAVLLALLASATRQAGRRFVGRWRALGLVFVYLALDEGVGIHELLTQPTRSLLPGDGWLQFAWVIPAGVLAGIVALASLPLLRDLPRRTAGLMIAGGALYVTGAIGMETVSGFFLTIEDMQTLGYTLASSLEETLEMVGVLVFIHALLGELTARTCEVRVVLTPGRRSEPESTE